MSSLTSESDSTALPKWCRSTMASADFPIVSLRQLAADGEGERTRLGRLAECNNEQCGEELSSVAQHSTLASPPSSLYGACSFS